MTYTATYSPDDNKLRLYASGRLPADVYARVKAAGFKWAPKQDLFVAPMWTPEREDLLLELAGEIDDEDRSLVERAEERAERFETYSDKRARDAESARKAVSAIADNIPLGQPILIGHHSEKHARRDAEKIENGMRKAVKMWRTSEYWTERAAGAIRHAKYKERPDVRARRIRGLEAELRKLDRADKETAANLARWALVDQPEKWKPNSDGVMPNREERAAYIAGHESGLGYVARSADGAKFWSAYDVLRLPAEERYKDAPAMTVDEVIEAIKRACAAGNARRARWREHYTNRLAYERAMLADAGGTAADKTGPEVGGACKCWASHRGGWSYIQKVNRVSVTVLDNWGNAADADGSRNFTRTMPLDKLAAVMTRAEVERARADGRLVEYADKTGFFLTDTPAPKPTQPKEDQKPEAKAFEAMAETLKNGGVQVVAAPQLFPTPRDVAERMVELADIQSGHRVLEPSAGTGALVTALDAVPGCAVVAVEIRHTLADALRLRSSTRTDVRCADFLELGAELGQFDRVVMNPPFENGADIKHIRHALSMLKPGGRLVGICAGGPRQAEALQPIASSWEELPSGTFTGTAVRSMLFVIDKEEEADGEQREELALSEQTRTELADKAKQARRGKVEQQRAALRDRDVCILSAPPGTAPARELDPQPVIQLNLI